jgi:hypothetical protein
LKLKGFCVEIEKTLPLIYNGVRTKKGYRLDLFVENKIVVEVKAAKAILPIDIAQMANVPDADRSAGRSDHELQRPLPEGRPEARDLATSSAMKKQKS